jgi:hypothetical protein
VREKLHNKTLLPPLLYSKESPTNYQHIPRRNLLRACQTVLFCFPIDYYNSFLSRETKTTNIMMASEAVPMEEQQQYDETEMGEEGEEEVSTCTRTCTYI